MHPSDTDVLEYHLRQLDGDALAALVADLWAARGYETSRENDTICATHGDDTLHIRIPRATEGTASHSGVPPDIVVAVGGAGGSSDARTVDAATLAEVLGYAVDRSVARGLCEQHLGAPPEDLPAPPLTRARRRAEGFLDRTTPAVLAVASVLALLTALLWVGPVPLAGQSGPATADDVTVVATPDTDALAAGTDIRADLDAPVENEASFPSSPRTPPPGVTDEGITDIEALATAHERAMANRSHTVWLDRYSERVNANTTRVQTDIDMMAEGDRYRITTTRVQSDAREPLGEVYHDGTVPYGAAYNETTGRHDRVFKIDPRHDVSPTPETVRKRAVGRFLSTAETNVTGQTSQDGTTLYRVVATGEPNATAFDTVHNYTAVAVIDARGHVREMTVEFTGRASGRIYRIRHEVTYDRIGSTTVDPPPWYEREVANATG